MRDPTEWVTLHGPPRPVMGTLASYLSRGWCRLETVAALCPKRFEGSGTWRPGPLNLRFRLHHDPDDPGIGRLVVSDDLLDPREGDFNSEADRAAIEPTLKKIALEYLEYEESGATSWDTMIDVSARPQWLKDLGEQALSEDAAAKGDPRNLRRRIREMRVDAREDAAFERQQARRSAGGTPRRLTTFGLRSSTDRVLPKKSISETRHGATNKATGAPAKPPPAKPPDVTPRLEPVTPEDSFAVEDADGLPTAQL